LRAAFGPAGISLELASPATPEAVYWAIDAARKGGARVGGDAREGSEVTTGTSALSNA
jgi:xanthine dehydrogenase large subunit